MTTKTIYPFDHRNGQHLPVTLQHMVANLSNRLPIATPTSKTCDPRPVRSRCLCPPVDKSTLTCDKQPFSSLLFFFIRTFLAINHLLHVERRKMEFYFLLSLPGRISGPFFLEQIFLLSSRGFRGERRRRADFTRSEQLAIKQTKTLSLYLLSIALLPIQVALSSRDR